MKKIILLLAVGVALTTQTLFAQVPSYVPINGLVGYWPFDGNVNDVSGNGNNGVLNSGNNGTLNYVTGQNGSTSSAIEFTSNPVWNQLGPHIILNNTQNVLTNSNFTINYFVSVNTTNQVGVIINKGPDNIPGIFQSVLINSTLQNFISGSGGVNQPNFVNNTWKMITVVFNMSGQLDLFVNGVLAQSTTTLSISSTMSNFILGAMPSGGSNGSFYPFQGKLDNVGFWNRALTQQEITNLFNVSQCITNITVTDTLIINVGQLSFNDPVTWANNITIAPNPASTQININFNNITNLNGGTLKVINSLGQEVATTPITTSGTNSTMQLATWGGSGMYFVQIINPQGQIVDIKKIILQ